MFLIEVVMIYTCEYISYDLQLKNLNNGLESFQTANLELVCIGW